MERNGVVLGERWSDRIDDGFDEFGGLGDGRDVHVLAVDDSLVDRKFLEHMLKRSSFKVTVVESGMRALQFLGLDEDRPTSSGEFDGLKVDLIITDYCMPGMTGYDLLKKIKESDSFREIPVVIMSSENILARIDRCLEEGAEEFIMKPVKLSDVKRFKNYTSKDARERNNRVGINKRKLHDSGFDLSLSSSSDSVSPSPSTSTSVCSSAVSSPSTFLVSSAPCSPSSTDSPTRRPKITSCSCL